MEDAEVIILLHVAEATGLYLRNENIILSATLGGNVLESDKIMPGSTTIFDVNLVWETDKKSIKRMKTENLPIKLECFSVASGSARRDLIGFVMIPMRGIQIATGAKLAKCVPRWHKLMGLPTEWKSLKPEICLYSTITESHNVKSVTALRNTQSIESISTENMLYSQQGIYVKLIQDAQYIQIGGDSSRDSHLFMVNITLKSLKGIEESEGRFHLKYTLLGSPCEDRLLTADPVVPGTFSIHENISIRFRSSLPMMREYFCKIFYIPCEVFCDEHLIGSIRLSMAHTFPTTITMNELMEAAKNSYKSQRVCSLVNAGDETVGGTTILPAIEYEFCLKLILPEAEQRSADITETTTTANESYAKTIPLDVLPNKSPITPEEEEDEEQDNFEIDRPHHHQSPHKVEEFSESWDRDGAIIDSFPPIQILPPAPPPPPPPPPPVRSVPHSFSYKLRLLEIDFNQSPEPGIWQLSLHHPKAHTPMTLLNISVPPAKNNNTKPSIENVEITLYFSAEPQYVHDIIASEPCQLQIRGPRGAYGTAEIDNVSLLAQEQTPGIILMENECNEKVAMARACAQLEDMGTNFNCQQRKFARPGGGGGGATTSKCTLDEELAYKMIEELEEWRGRQQEAFVVDLKKREIEHLAHLTTEWRRRRSELEQKLTHKLDQCNLLTTALEEASQTVKENNIKELERQRIFDTAKLELERKYARQLMQMQERTRRCEDDAAYALKLSELKLNDLQIRFDSVQTECKAVREHNERLTDELQHLRLTAIPVQQLDEVMQDVKMLNEKLIEAQKSKLFYKEQWAKIIREMHKFKEDIGGGGDGPSTF